MIVVGGLCGGGEKCSRCSIAWLKRPPEERLQAAAGFDISAAKGGKREKEREREEACAVRTDRRRETDDQASSVSASSGNVSYNTFPHPPSFFRETLMDRRHVDRMTIYSMTDD